jgi:hypothetical protein
VPETRARLEALAGGATQADALVEAARKALPRLREYQLENPLPQAAQASADFFVLLAPGRQHRAGDGGA